MLSQGNPGRGSPTFEGSVQNLVQPAKVASKARAIRPMSWIVKNKMTKTHGLLLDRIANWSLNKSALISSPRSTYDSLSSLIHCRAGLWNTDANLLKYPQGWKLKIYERGVSAPGAPRTNAINLSLFPTKRYFAHSLGVHLRPIHTAYGCGQKMPRFKTSTVGLEEASAAVLAASF